MIQGRYMISDMKGEPLKIVYVIQVNVMRKFASYNLHRCCILSDSWHVVSL